MFANAHVRLLLAAIFLACGPSTLCWAQDDPLRQLEVDPPGDRPEAAIVAALESRADFSYVDTPLDEVVSDWRDRFQINICIDTVELGEVGLDGYQPLSFSATDVRFETALFTILEQQNLNFFVRDNLLIVTTKGGAENNLQVRVYDVADLVYMSQGDGPNFDSLRELITSTVDPVSWDQVGGPGSMEGYEARGLATLVIAQTWHHHREIERLLGQLRATRHELPEPEHGDQMGWQEREIDHRWIMPRSTRGRMIGGLDGESQLHVAYEGNGQLFELVFLGANQDEVTVRAITDVNQDDEHSSDAIVIELSRDDLLALNHVLELYRRPIAPYTSAFGTTGVGPWPQPPPPRLVHLVLTWKIDGEAVAREQITRSILFHRLGGKDTFGELLSKAGLDIDWSTPDAEPEVP